VYTAGHSFAVYSLATKSIVYETNVGAANYRSSAFSPDGRELAVSSDDGGGAVFRADGAEKAVIDVGLSIDTFIEVRPLALTPDRVVAALSPTTGPDKGLEVVKSWSWNGKQAAPQLFLTRHNNYPWFGIDPLGRNAFIAVTEDAARWSPEKTFSRPSPMQIWDLEKRRIVQRPVTMRGFSLLPTISGDGSHLVVNVVGDPSGQQWVTLVDLARGKITLRAKAPCLRFGDPAVSADGSHVAAISYCPGLLTWRITPTGPVAHPLPVAVSTESGPLAFSADARRLAIANISGQGEVGIVDARSGKTLATLAGHTDRVVGVLFSPDGKLAVTSSRDATVRVWDTLSGRLLRTFDHPAPLAVAGIASSPDGHTIATLDEDGVIRLWDTCTDCENPAALMALAKTRVTRGLTASEKQTYLG
jgi:WD40 repeat protein